MFRQKPSCSTEQACNTKATLRYASTLKAHIQDQVFELTAALKKVEHELCMQIDQKCREKLQGFEYLCENDKCVAGCQNLSTQFIDDIGFPNKSKFDYVLKTSMRLVQHYEKTRRVDKFFSQTSEADKNTLVKKQVESKENISHVGDSEDCFEFVDSVECLKEELNSEIRNVLKSTNKYSPPSVDYLEEALERASCSSVDSFDVIPNECCMNDSICTNAQTPLPCIVPLLPKLPETSSSEDGPPGHTTFYLPNRRAARSCKAPPGFFALPNFAAEKVRHDFFSQVIKEKEERIANLLKWQPPPQKAPANTYKPAEGDRVCMFTSKGTASQNGEDPGITFSFHGPAREKSKSARVPAATEGADDIEVIPSTSEAKQEMCAGIVSPKGVLGGLFSTSKTKASPAQEMSTNASVKTTTEVADDFEVIPSTSEANAIAQQGMSANESVPTAVVDDVEVIRSTSEAKQEMTVNATENTSPEKKSAVSQDENNPANALQDSFKPYRQKQDLKAWVQPNSEPRSKSYEDWVFRGAAPSNPLSELPNGSACASDRVGSAFYRQLQGFLA